MIQNTPYKTYLEENEIPKAWYNLRADMKNKPAPLLNPGTLQPMTAQELSGVFCEDLVKQELDNTTREFEIPDEIYNFYKMYRPSPLVHAEFLEKALDTPAHIYYKFEGNNTSGSHKLNSAPVGDCAVHGLRVFPSRLQSIHGQGLLRTEAVPPRSYANVRRFRNSFAV